MEVWIGRNGERHGPYPESSIRQWLASGQVSRDDLGWYEGLADWQPLAVLFPDASPAAPTTAPPALSPYAPPLSPAEAPVGAALDDYAGFWKRVVAFVLDYIVLFIPTKLLGMLFGATEAEAALQKAQLATAGDPQATLIALNHYMHAMAPALLISGLLVWLYFAACESSVWQATVGKLAMGIRVTDLEGQRISFQRALGRYIAKFLSFLILYIGVMMVGWTARKQGLHDMIAGTLVLNGRAGTLPSTAASSGGGTFSA